MKPLTPGRLALIGVAALVLSFAFPFAAGTTGMSEPPTWVWYVLPTTAALFLVGAAVAKVVQIGVRSAKN
jgi:hypothetical protein